MSQKVDPKLQEAIAFFEKMLQTMPGDRTGLEFLSVAYEQTGERDKQIAALVKLSETLLKEGDMEHAAMIAQKLRSFPIRPKHPSRRWSRRRSSPRGRWPPRTRRPSSRTICSSTKA